MLHLSTDGIPYGRKRHGRGYGDGHGHGEEGSFLVIGLAMVFAVLFLSASAMRLAGYGHEGVQEAIWEMRLTLAAESALELCAAQSRENPSMWANVQEQKEKKVFQCTDEEDGIACEVYALKSQDGSILLKAECQKNSRHGSCLRRMRLVDEKPVFVAW